MKKEPLALGIDLGGSSVKWGVVSPDGSVVAEGREEITDHAPEAVADVIRGQIGIALDKGEGRVVAVGVGSPGLIDRTRTVVRVSPNFPKWKDVHLVHLLRDATGELPTFLENDANLLVYSETRWGAAVGAKNVVVLTLGTGVGGGVMVEGAVLRGIGGGAAELGHIPIDYHGPVCSCGNTGCLEAYCNIRGTMREAGDVYAPHKPPANPEELTEAARGGDERAIEVWRRIGTYLGIGVAGLVNIFNPEVFLVGGGIAGAGEFIFGPAREVAAERAYRQNWEDVTFRQAALEEKAGLFGAAALAFDEAGVTTRYNAQR